HAIHGDLACRNILVFTIDENEPYRCRVKLTDFGFSRGSNIHASVAIGARTAMNIVPVRYTAQNIDFSSILREYQKTFGLKETGTLDEPTIELLNTPRCGNKDSPLSSSLLALANSKWRKNRLRWTLRNSSSRISHAQSLNIIRDAFEHWIKHIPLDIEQVCTICEADVVFNFGPVDGPSRMLAYAYLPEDGRVHFDSAENWIERFDHNGTNLFLVAVHEIGHALGLDHTLKDKQSIMYPTYQLIPKGDILRNIDRQWITDKYGVLDLYLGRFEMDFKLSPIASRLT
ncbi:unnamed protein product, partial [Didymodactylos carnosus]